jgi:uncharacterized protein YndB with AHSA1/START domain
METKRATGSGSLVAEAETTVRASVVVDAPIEHAFRVFTADMGAWWPASHHIADVPMAAAILEPRVGGRWYELGEDGSTCDWGVLLAWEPPHHVAFSWHLDGDFRLDRVPGHASRVDVRFTSRDDGSTSVELEHSGLDRHGEGWQRLRDGVRPPRGWTSILQLYAARATTSRSAGR